MNRGFLMALLALDLFVMGTSAYVLWDRVHRNIAAPVPKMLVQQAPAAAAPPAAPAAQPPAANPATEKQEAPEKTQEQTQGGISTRRILFRYRDAVPQRVAIVGTFNRWRAQSMRKDRNHLWSIVLKLRPGTYAYNFLVDGKMIRDPANRRAKKAGQKIPSSVLVVQAR